MRVLDELAKISACYPLAASLADRVVDNGNETRQDTVGK